MHFPFPSPRPQQDVMMKDVKNAIGQKRHLVANAPTGLGKTIAALYPAVEYAEANGKDVFFLTSRLSQHKMVIETLQRMGKINTADIIGKKWLCSHDVRDMDSSMFSNFCYSMVKDDMCKYYENFKKKGEVTENAKHTILALKRDGPLHSEDAKKMASERFCTYEILMEIAKTSRVVVADYFHVFSGMGKKFFRRMSKDLENSIIIVDEAHNLPNRIRNNLSSKITTRTIELAKKESQGFDLHVDDYIEYLEEAIKSIAKEKLFSANESFIAKEDLIDRVEKLCSYKSMAAAFAGAGEKVLKERKRSHIERLAMFLDSWTGADYGYARIISREVIDKKDRISVFYNCMDPSIMAKPIINESHSTILMSGTLTPMDMYRDLLGIEPDRTELRSYSSPFPKENRLNIITTGITTQYRERTPENYAKIAMSVAFCATSIKGNAAVFFPSYEIMKKIYALSKGSINKPIMIEQQGMTKEDRKKLQEEFAAQHRNGAALFGVLAGSFSEGIDLPGNRLNGVVIVGLPLEKPTLSMKALIDYYDQRFKKGREYGYVYPAMIKVMQAAGRCIRTEKDIGVCVFADERFLWRNYKCIFPSEWEFNVTERPEIEIKKFFEQNAKKIEEEYQDSIVAEETGIQPAFQPFYSAKSYSLDQIRQAYPKAYEKWAEDEDAKLKNEYINGKTISQLAVMFQRKEGAIRSRLKKLELLQ